MKNQQELPAGTPKAFRYRRLDAGRLKSKFAAVRDTTEALKKANIIRPALLKSRVGI